MDTVVQTRTATQVVEKAGTVVLQDIGGTPCILLVYRPKRDDWELPKGHVEPQEDLLIAATRETKEETGYTVRILAPLPPHEYIAKMGEAVRCHYFHAELVDQPARHETEEVPLWVPVTHAQHIISKRRLREYVESILPTIQ